MVDINREMYERNDIEIIVDNDAILWLNGKRIEEGLNHKRLWVTTVKYLCDHRKNRYKLLDELKTQRSRNLTN